MGSEAFQAYQARIVNELQRATNACSNASDMVEIYRAQGAALALRAVLRIPETMAREAAQAVKEGLKHAVGAAGRGR
jgi:hypothetical protein